MPSRSAAFSLVELSIVLVILGLLVGFVASSRAMVRSAELRAVVTERDKFIAAIGSFRSKYFQLPGDMSNAYPFWGATCGTDATTASTGCNGDGDGAIEYENGETTKLWEHLARASLIEGSYDGTGTDSGSGRLDVATETLPKSKLSNTYWDASNRPEAAAGSVTAYIAGSSNLYLRMGGVVHGTYNLTPDAVSLTHSELWNIDTKTDDGRANTGTMRGDTTHTCTDTATDYYTLTSGGADTADCMMHFVLQQ